MTLYFITPSSIHFVAWLERDEKVRKCVLGMSLKIQICCVFIARIDVCRVRPCVIGRASASLGVVGMLGEQCGTAGGRGGDVGVCVLCVSQHISRF